MDYQFPEDPYAFFQKWLKEATDTEENDPNAMCLATADKQGRPSARMMLLKSVGEDGFTFYTNYESNKGHQLLENPFAALCFHWKSLGRQVRVEGKCAPVSDEEADRYFASRPRESRIGAWASEQSRPVESREAFETRLREYEHKYAGQDVPRPPYWSGFCLAPEKIEFWLQEEFRLHRRLVYTKTADGWDTEMLYP